MSTESAAICKKGVSAGSIQPSVDRVYRLAASLVASGEKTDGLNAGALGALMILVKLASTACADSGRIEFPTKQARLALSMRGIPAVELDLVFGALQISGHVAMQEDMISVTSVTCAYQAEANLLARRRAGWKKRLETSVGSQVEDGLATTKNVKKVDKAPLKAIKQEEPINSKVDVAVISEPKLLTRRFASLDSLKTEAESDPVVVRLACEGGKVAEITQDYVTYLQGIFSDIETPVQLKLMANWLESNPTKRKTFAGIRRFINSWLKNASAAQSMRRELIKSSAQRNGFGSGGAYSYDVASKDDQDGDADDLTDLFEERKQETLKTQQASGSQVVAAARNRATFLRQSRVSSSTAGIFA
jgi:hypothetical protein